MQSVYSCLFATFLLVRLYGQGGYFGFHVTLSFYKKKINRSKFLVSSDARPSNNLNFCNVQVRQGSSLRNRVRWNFQVCVNERASSRADR